MYGAAAVGIFGLFNVPFIALAILASFAPTISAVVVLGRTEGKAEIGKLFSKFLVWKVGFSWYLATISITITSVLVAITYLYSQGMPVPDISLSGLLSLLLAGLVLGPLSEEAGWSGYALPKLQAKFSALTSSLILGSLWAVWHLPLWFIPETSQSTMNFGLFFVALVAVRLIMGWAYNNTKGSLLIAVLFHLFFNFGNELGVDIFGTPMNVFLLYASAAILAYAVVVIVYSGYQNLSRKNIKIHG